MINLRAFMGEDDDPRTWLTGPFKYKDGIGATNGHILIHLFEHSYSELVLPDPAVDIGDIFSNEPVTGWMPLVYQEVKISRSATSCWGCGGTGKQRERKTCTECDGDGYVYYEGESRKYVIPCPECHEEGTVIGDPIDLDCERCCGLGFDPDLYPCDLGDMKISKHYAGLIENLPGIEISTLPDKGMCYFRFDGGHGVVMGLRD